MHVNADNIQPVSPSALAAMQLGPRTLAEWVERSKQATPPVASGDVTGPSARQRVVLDRVLDDVLASPAELDQGAARVEAERKAYRRGEADALAGRTMSPPFGDDLPNLQNRYVDGYANGTEYSG